MAEGLAAHGAEVVVVCPEASDEKQGTFNFANVSLHSVEKSNRAMELLSGLMRAVIRNDPLQTALFSCSRLHQAVCQLHRVQPFDAVVVQLARIGPVAQSLAQEMPVILDMVDLLSLNFQRRAQIARKSLGLLYAIEAERLRRLELTLSQRMHVLLANSSERDAAIAAGAPESHVHLLTNGVQNTSELKTSRDIDVIFSGNLSYEPNVRAVEFLANVVAPGLQQQSPNAVPSIHVVGANPNNIVQHAVAKRGLHLHANVPSVSAMLGRSRVMAAPILAATGVQNKVLEAMAAGCVPVVTPAAISGIPGFLDGVHGVCITDPIDFPAAIIKLLNDIEAWERISQAGRQFAEHNYGWRHRVDPLVKLILPSS